MCYEKSKPKDYLFFELAGLGDRVATDFYSGEKLWPAIRKSICPYFTAGPDQSDGHGRSFYFSCSDLTYSCRCRRELCGNRPCGCETLVRKKSRSAKITYVNPGNERWKPQGSSLERRNSQLSFDRF